MSDSLETLWTVARQAPLSMGFPRQEYWSGLPFPPPGDLPDPGIETVALATTPALEVDSLPLSQGEAFILVCVPISAICSFVCFVFWIVFTLLVHSMEPEHLNSLPDLQSTNSVKLHSPDYSHSQTRHPSNQDTTLHPAQPQEEPSSAPSHHDCPGEPFPAKTAICPCFFYSFTFLILLWQKQYNSTVGTLENTDNQKRGKKENLSPSHTPGNF